MSASRPYVDVIVNTSKHAQSDLKRQDILISALNSRRAFDGANYQGEGFKQIRQEQIRKMTEIFNKLTIPPENEKQRKEMITKLHAYYHEIGMKIENELTASMKESLGVEHLDEETEKKIKMAVTNYFFNLLPDLKVTNKVSENLINEISKFYAVTNENAVSQFDKNYKENLHNKVNKLDAAMTYVNMVNKSYLRNILKNDKALQSKFNEIANRDVTREIEETGKHVKSSESIADSLSQLQAELSRLESEIDSLEENIMTANAQIRQLNWQENLGNKSQTQQGITKIQSELIKYELAKESLISERETISDKFNNLVGPDANKKNISLADNIQNEITKFQKSVNIFKEKLVAFNRSEEFKEVVKDSKRNEITRFFKKKPLFDTDKFLDNVRSFVIRNPMQDHSAKMKPKTMQESQDKNKTNETGNKKFFTRKGH